MKVLICGSRGWTDWEAVDRRVGELPDDAVIIEGEADGADKMSRVAALRRGMFVAKVPADAQHWHKWRRSAGHKRNAIMLSFDPDLVIAFQLNGSKGTQGTIDEARRRGIPVEVVTASDDGWDEIVNTRTGERRRVETVSPSGDPPAADDS